MEHSIIFITLVCSIAIYLSILGILKISQQQVKKCVAGTNHKSQLTFQFSQNLSSGWMLNICLKYITLLFPKEDYLTNYVCIKDTKCHNKKMDNLCKDNTNMHQEYLPPHTHLKNAMRSS